MDYSAEVRRRFAAPRGVGLSSAGDGVALCGEAQDRALRVWVRFQVEVRGRHIVAVHFQVYGCPHTIAAASLLTELLEGQSLALLRGPWARELAAALEVPEEKLGRLLVLEDALRACVKDEEQGS